VRVIDMFRSQVDVNTQRKIAAVRASDATKILSLADC